MKLTLTCMSFLKHSVDKDTQIHIFEHPYTYPICIIYTSGHARAIRTWRKKIHVFSETRTFTVIKNNLMQQPCQYNLCKNLISKIEMQSHSIHTGVDC